MLISFSLLASKRSPVSHFAVLPGPSEPPKKHRKINLRFFMHIHIKPKEKLKKGASLFKVFGFLFQPFSDLDCVLFACGSSPAVRDRFSKIHYFSNVFFCKSKQYYKTTTKMPSSQQASQRFSDLIQPFSHSAIVGSLFSTFF